jgi:hypothetical protein
MPFSTYSEFRFDNSFAARKLIRLVRADTTQNFAEVDPATGMRLPASASTAAVTTYFQQGNSFTPSSSVPSVGSGGPNGVKIDEISSNGETMRLRIGLVSQQPGPSSFADGQPQSPAEQFNEAVGEVGTSIISLDELEELDRLFSRANSSQLAGAWQDLLRKGPKLDGACPVSAALRLAAAHWGAKSGVDATHAVEGLEVCDFRTQTFELTVETWANSNQKRLPPSILTTVKANSESHWFSNSVRSLLERYLGIVH